MSTNTAREFCIDCGKMFNRDCGHVCKHPGRRMGVDRLHSTQPMEFVTVEVTGLDQLRETNRAMKEQLDIATDLGEKRFQENVRLRAEVTRLEGINETALHLLTQYGDKADEYEAAEREQAAKIAELAAQVRQKLYPEYERLTSENERLRARLADYVGAGKAAEGIDSNIPY
jgi:hypothetical protein